MRSNAASLIFVSSVLVTGSAFADASIQIGIDSNPTNAQLNDSDPAAVSGSMSSSATNMTLGLGLTAAAADMTAGTLRCRAVGTLIDAGNFPYCTINVGDQITLSGPPGNVVVVAHVALDGEMTLAQNKPADGCSVAVYASLELGNGADVSDARAQFDYVFDGHTDGGVHDHVYSGTVSNGGSDTSPNAQITVSANVTVGTPTTIGIELGVNSIAYGVGGDSSSMEFGNTARISLDIPAGYTFTSASGNFLTHPGAPGLALPPDGGTGVHGVGDAGESSDSGGSDASIGANGDGGSSIDGGTSGNGDGSSGDDGGGCNTSSSTPGYGAALLFTGLAIVAGRRRRARSSNRNSGPG